MDAHAKVAERRRLSTSIPTRVRLNHLIILKRFMRKYAIGAGVALAVAGAYYLGVVSTKHPAAFSQSQQFDSALVNAKERCKEAVEKWDETNHYTGTAAHFNQNLNACLVEDVYYSSVDRSSSSRVIDIVDDKTLLELDTGARGTVPASVNLYENGQKVDTAGDLLQEYLNRKGRLFEYAQS